MRSNPPTKFGSPITKLKGVDVPSLPVSVRVVLSILVYPANARKVAVADPGALDWLMTYPDTVAVR
jgi:hypothetical protein